jgi:sigma-B regulation protein RsbQ
MPLDPLRKNNVVVAGNGSADDTIVFLHGFGTDQSAWREVAHEFEARHRLVFLDNVGAGGSPPEAFVQHRYLNLRAYAADLVEVCDALRLRRATFVGHSAGGITGVLAAGVRPELFSRLVLIEVPRRGYRGGFTKADVDAIYEDVLRSHALWADRFATAAMANAERPQLADAFARALKGLPPQHVLTALCAIFQSDHRMDLGAVSAPTLVLQTRQDVAVPIEAAEFLARGLPRGELRLIDAEGHFPHVSDPGVVAGAIAEFLERHPRGATGA